MKDRIKNKKIKKEIKKKKARKLEKKERENSCAGGFVCMIATHTRPRECYIILISLSPAALLQKTKPTFFF